MAAGDYAILVGISKYAASDAFSELRGPPNDVELFKRWLMSPEGGDIADQSHINEILSPSVVDKSTDLDDVPPLSEHFKKEFKKLVRDEQGRFINREGRLYLYFSGHGFCEKKSLFPQGALYAANATREFPENIYGTYYAHIAKDKALFSEIVLIMDCCRDAEVNRSADVPTINEAGAGAAQSTKLLCIYAAPKGGKAQERVIVERDNRVCGLLTHAVLKALAEATPDAPDGRISSAGLRKHLLETWTGICGDIPAPRPEIVLPTGEELYLKSSAKGVNQVFELAQLPAADTTVEILGGVPQQSIARCLLRAPPAPSLIARGARAQQELAFDGRRFELALPAGLYKYVLSGGLQKQGLFAVEGGADVHL